MSWSSSSCSKKKSLNIKFSCGYIQVYIRCTGNIYLINLAILLSKPLSVYTVFWGGVRSHCHWLKILVDSVPVLLLYLQLIGHSHYPQVNTGRLCLLQTVMLCHAVYTQLLFSIASYNYEIQICTRLYRATVGCK